MSLVKRKKYILISLPPPPACTQALCAWNGARSSAVKLGFPAHSNFPVVDHVPFHGRRAYSVQATLLPFVKNLGTQSLSFSKNFLMPLCPPPPSPRSPVIYSVHNELHF